MSAFSAYAEIGVSIQPSLVSYEQGWKAKLRVILSATEAETPRALAIQIAVPESAAYAGLGTPNPQNPQSVHGEVRGTVECAWYTVPAFPFSFDVFLKFPPQGAGPQALAAHALYRIADGPELESSTATAAVWLYADPDGHHSADCCPSDWNIDIGELLRVIQLYNSFGFSCLPASEDGYGAGPGSHACYPHELDYNPQDWSINLSELLRLIQFYNIGAFIPDTTGTTEDGFQPIYFAWIPYYYLDNGLYPYRGGQVVELAVESDFPVPHVSVYRGDALIGTATYTYSAEESPFWRTHHYEFRAPYDIDGWMNVKFVDDISYPVTVQRTIFSLFRIDNTPPSIAIAGPLSDTVPVWWVYYEAGAEIDLDPEDIALNTTDGATADVIVETLEGSPDVRIVRLENLSGTGSIGISLLPGTAQDAVGNIAGFAGPSALASVNPPLLNATMAARPTSYILGYPLALDFAIHGPGDLAVNALAGDIGLPQGWTVIEAVGDAPDVVDFNAAAHSVALSWSAAPAFPVLFTLRVQVPPTGAGTQTVQAQFRYDAGAGTVPILPDYVQLTPATTFHDLDNHPADWHISLQELLRVIQLGYYGGYDCDPESEDGYGVPGISVPDHTCAPHDLDYSPQDWAISLNETLRAVQFYNAGGYYPDANGEDGYSPGQP